MKSFRSDIYQVGSQCEVRAGAVDPTTAGGIAAPLTSLYFQTATGVLWQKTSTPDTGWTRLLLSSFYGDGADGDVVIPAGTTTLARDMFYDNLVVQNGANLVTAGFRIYVREVATIEVGGVISHDGNPGVAGAGGAAINVGSIFGSGIWGGAGGSSTNNNGNNGTAVANVYPEAIGLHQGGAGGVSGVRTGGAGGTLTLNTENPGRLRSITAHGGVYLSGSTTSSLRMASGGGGGAGSGAALGGGGGSGGGLVVMYARELNNEGTIRALGGAGEDASNVDSAGGGGGGGGWIGLGFHYFSGNAPDVSGGDGGTGNGIGAAGSAGQAGQYVPLQL